MSIKNTHIDNIIPNDFEDKKLYHYTSSDGLIGIMLKGKIWCTQIFYLNDQEELINGWRLFFDILDKYEDEFKDKVYVNPNIRAWKSLFIKNTDSFINFTNFPIHDFQYFIFCLSSEDDDLSQWRGYSSENSGYAIEFKINDDFFSKQKDFTTTTKPNFEKKSVILLKRCIYNNEEKYKLLETILEVYKQKGEFDTWELFFDIASLFFFFKSDEFHHENEYRMLICLDKENQDKIEFRKGKTTLIPYIEIDVEYSTITGITISPTPSKQHSMSSLKMLINRIIKKNKNLNYFEPKHSNLSYRAW